MPALLLVPRGGKKTLPYTGVYGSMFPRQCAACNAVKAVKQQPSFASITNDVSNTPNFGMLQMSRSVSIKIAA